MKTYKGLFLLALGLLFFTNCRKKDSGIEVIETNETKIELTVSNIKEQTGFIQIGLYNSEENWDIDIAKGEGGNEFLVDRVEVEGNEVKFNFDDVSPGFYALSIYHDENNNNTLDKDNLLGIVPQEPYGFSNNFKPGSSGAPKFSDCSFEVAENTTSIITIDLID